MKNVLYHGTYEDMYKKIIKEGLILNFTESYEETTVINKVLNDYKNSEVREGAIFLTDDKSLIEFYDYTIEIDIKKLNTNLLYVADNKFADNIFDSYYCQDKKRMDYFVREYLNSLIPFEEYKKIEKEYNKDHKFREFLYFDSIKLCK